jgi:hypothetical protein
MRRQIECYHQIYLSLASEHLPPVST